MTKKMSRSLNSYCLRVTLSELRSSRLGALNERIEDVFIVSCLGRMSFFGVIF